MLVLALALAAAAPDQLLGGPAFEAFARRTDRACPARHLRATTAGDLDWQQEQFQDRLPPARQRRLAAANRAAEACAGRNGLSCPVGRTLDAMRRTGLIGSFATFACSHPAP